MDQTTTRYTLALVVFGGVAGMVFGARYMRDMQRVSMDAQRVYHASHVPKALPKNGGRLVPEHPPPPPLTAPTARAGPPSDDPRTTEPPPKPPVA